jgi:hypothetical protein
MLPNRVAISLLLLLASSSSSLLADVTGECADTYYFGVPASGTQCSSTIPNNTFSPNADPYPQSPSECWSNASTSTSLSATSVTSTDCWGRFGFRDPSWDPATGAGLQTFRIKACRQGTDPRGDPEIDLGLWEDGSDLSVESNGNTVTTDCGSGYDEISYTWNASSLSNSTGDDVQLRVDLVNAGGSPANQNNARLAYVEWVIVMVDPTPQPPLTISRLLRMSPRELLTLISRPLRGLQNVSAGR